MTSDVVLTAAMRSNLLSLQSTQSSIDTIQNRLATGLKVASALDNPQNFFASESLKNRASDLSRLLDSMGQSIQTIKSANNGVTALKTLVDQAESIIESASEAITNGAVEASITGDANLRGVRDLTDFAGINAGDNIVFTYYDPAAPSTIKTAAVPILAGDSIDQLITKISDIEGGGVFKAELTSDGRLKITELQGKAFNIAFQEGAPDNLLETGDLALATTLGFGGKVEAVSSGTGTNGKYEVTVLARTKLVSGAFYDLGGSGYANASAMLTAVADADGGATARFNSGLAAQPTNLVFTLNGETSITVPMEDLSIQGLVDAINTDPNNTGLIKASYDATTGQFSIEATSQKVNSINVRMDVIALDTGAQKADFDFGMVGSFSSGGTELASYGETFRLANAAEKLAHLEKDYNTLLKQIDELAADAGYRGINLLKADSLTTYFDEDRESKLTITGADLTSTGMKISQANFNTITNISAARTEILAAKETVRNFGSTLANGLSIVQTREVFTKSMITTLTEGSDKLVVADQNEEGARLLALQTRQQLGVISLSMASQAQQAVLRLF